MYTNYSVVDGYEFIDYMQDNNLHVGVYYA